MCVCVGGVTDCWGVEGTARVPLYAEGGWRTHSAPVFPQIQRRDFCCSLAKDGREGERERASYFSDVDSACECDACVGGVGNILRARCFMSGYCFFFSLSFFLSCALQSECLRNNWTRKFSWFAFS